MFRLVTSMSDRLKLNPDAVDALRFEIVKLAILDYQKSLKTLRKISAKSNPSEKEKIERATALSIKKECVDFFCGKWYATLCGIDGKLLMDTVRSKYYNMPIRWADDFLLHSNKEKYKEVEDVYK